MNVLVETNFVLELVFSRDKFLACRALIDLAETRQIQLMLPAYCMVEPYEAIIRRRKSRVQAHELLTREVREITRSTHFVEPANQLAALTGLLIQVGQDEQQELRNVLSKLLQVASIIELKSAILTESLVWQDEKSMSPQDAVVFSSILSALRAHGGPACFITKNSKDFSDPAIEEALSPFGCELLFDFERGLNLVRKKIGAAHP